METASSPALLLLGLPSGALGGIDLLSFTTSPKFNGIKHIPAGVHFAFAGATTSLSLRHGLWFIIPHEQSHTGTSGHQPLIVTKWNPNTEALVLETSEPEILRQRANIGALWRERLTPYRQTATNDSQVQARDGDAELAPRKAEEGVVDSGAWIQLSNAIDTRVLTRTLGDTPEQWTLNSSTSAAIDDDNELKHHLDKADASSHDTRNALQHLSSAEQTLRLLPIDFKQTWPPSATGRERTLAARDRSWYLTHLIQTHTITKTASIELPSELQFCFLMALTLNNYSCLAQWRRLVTLILTCKTLVPSEPQTFEKCIHLLGEQMEYIAESDDESNSVSALFELDDESTGKSWLTGLLEKFRSGIRDLVLEQETEDLKRQTKRQCEGVMDTLRELCRSLREGMNWQVEDDDEDTGDGLLATEGDTGRRGKNPSTILRSGKLQLEDGEIVDMDLKTSDTYDMEHDLREYAPVIVDMN